MQTEDLSKVKYIGASRMKSLNDLGITTIKQLCETPLNKLSRISTIGKYYAKLIKAEANKAYKEKPGEIASKIVSKKEKKIEKFKQDLDQKIKVLKKRLEQASEDLKPLGKKKINSDFNKRSKTLMNRLDGLDKIKEDLSSKISKNIIKKADVLSKTLKNMGKKPKNKKYKKLSQVIQSFSKMVKKTGS